MNYYDNFYFHNPNVVSNSNLRKQAVEKADLKLIKKIRIALLENEISYNYYTNVEFRTKKMSSLLTKIRHYVNKDEPFYTYKCLNDLMGFRIIIDSESFKELYVRLGFCKNNDKIVRENVKYVNRETQDGYKAIHCYFGNKNNEFNWELQIWNSQDESLNRKLHADHEREKKVIIRKRGD